MSPVDTPAETAQHGVSHRVLDGRMYGYRLVIVRLMCLSLCVLSVGLFVASIPSFFAYLHILCMDTAATCSTSSQLAQDDVIRLHQLGLSIDFFATYTIVLAIIFALGYWFVAAFLFWRKSDDRMALLAAVTLGTFPLAFNSEFIHTLPSLWGFLANCISFLGSLCIVLFFYVFPGGHFVPRWTRWVMVPSLAYWVFDVFFPVAPFNPFFRFPVLGNVTFLGIIGGMVVVQVYRYRRVSNPTQRQQTKWVVYGVTMGIGGLLIVISIAVFLLSSLFPNGSLASFIGSAAVDGLMLLIPLSIGFAVLRSQLWEIDNIINRTLVYGTLTATLALIYVCLVILLQFLLRGMLNQNTDVAIVGSTLIIAALFQPLRQRIQQVIDRRFYRHKYDAARTLAAFSATLRNEVDLNQLREQLVGVVQETMQPTHVSLWLRNPQQYRQQNTRLLPRIDEEERVPS
jgi:hypothetical protein